MRSLFIFFSLLSLIHAKGSVTCNEGGPDYWCKSCDNAKECSPEIEGLLRFCQEDLGMLLDCTVPNIYEGVYNADSDQQTTSDYFSSPSQNDYQFDGGYQQYTGYPQHEVRYLDLGTDVLFSDGSLPPQPAFERGKFEGFDTSGQWGYTQDSAVELGPTTMPPLIITDNTEPVTEEPITATLQNPTIEPPTITRPLYNVSAYVGQATVLSCVAESEVDMGVSISKLNREPKRKWLQDQTSSRRRGGNNRSVKKIVTAFLTIDHLDEVDSGWYVCTAVNEGGRERSLMYLNITDLCEGVICSGNHLACIPDYKTRTTTCGCPSCDNQLELVCGSNCKTYQNDCWLKYDNCQNGFNHSMMIHAPCPRIIAPIFTVEPSDIEVEEGHHLILECHALSFPLANYQWYKVNELENNADIFIGEGSQYKVDEAMIDDEGGYYCIASICENGHTLRSRTAHVDLNEHNLSTKTKTTYDRVCRVFGDPHITTFDGMSYNYPGQCSYILAMDCELARWSVYGKFENCSSMGVQGSCLNSITIVYENSAMELQRGWAINHQGEKIDFFEAQRHEVPNFHFDLDDNLNLHVNLENGASIIWDGLYSVQIKLADDDTTKYCGLCGNGDGNYKNDLVASSVYYGASEKEVDVHTFGESWKIDPYASCPDYQLLAVPRCSVEDNTKAEEECIAMFKHPIVAACESILDSSYYIQSCIEDSCALKQWEGTFDPKCGVVSAYTSACRVLGLQVYDDSWRSSVGCTNLKEHQSFVLTTGCPKSTLVSRS